MAGGMRYGAGRPARHAKAEHCRSIDVRVWARQGFLMPGFGASWRWTNSRTGEDFGSIAFRIEASTAVLDYYADGERIVERARLDYTACTLGGQRAWFICPACGRRAAKLFLRHKHFECQTCCALAYSSQSEDRCGRAWRKQSKLESKLDEHWRRPKGMHKSTHRSLLAAIWACEDLREDFIDAFLTRMRARHPAVNW